MKIKNRLILLGIIMGVISCFGLNKLYAANITSAFSDVNINRDNLSKATKSSTIEQKWLGISEKRERGNSYEWNVDSLGNGKKVWKIATYSSEDIDLRDYEDLYYCLNVKRGFGLTNGEMAEGEKDEYTTSVDMLDTLSKEVISGKSGGNIGENYNKVLWILSKAYVPGQTSSEAKTELLKNALEYVKSDETRFNKLSGILPNGIVNSIISENMIESEESHNLTDEDIDVVQQMAIWYYTNSDDSAYHLEAGILPAIYLNDAQLRAQGELYYVKNYAKNVNVGAIREWKMNALFMYLIDNADKAEEIQSLTPTISLDNKDAVIDETDKGYIVGPFKFDGTNTELIKSLEATVSPSTYTLLDKDKKAVSENDFSKVLGTNFYIQISKEDTKVQISLKAKYDKKTLTYLTNINDPENTQPVVLVKSEEKELLANTNKDINLISISVEKKWEDVNNQDGKRPTEIKVQLYRNNEEYGDSITLNSDNNWKYKWDNLLKDYEYTVKELNGNNIKVENGSKYDENYTATYVVEENNTTITNTYAPGKVVKIVEKKWNDNGNSDKLRPDQVTVQLYADGEAYGEEVILNESNSWKYTWNDLDEKKDGKDIVYTVKEIKIGDTLVDEDKTEDYTVSYEINNNTTIITNTHVPEKVIRKVEKKWDDKDNLEKLRPTQITVQLYADGEAYGEEVILNESNSWKYTWDNLDGKKDGKNIVYTVKEIKVGDILVDEDKAGDYTVSYEVNDNITTITNTHIVDEKKFDLALRKFITEVNGTKYTDREPVVDTTTIATSGTATYKHTKQPIAVQKGDIVTYTIRVYNEGKVDGYVNKITDHLPKNLIPILRTTVEDVDKYEKEIEFNENWLWAGDESIIQTEITSKETESALPNITKTENETDEETEQKQKEARLLKAAYKEDGTVNTELDYVDVQVKCLVTDGALRGEYLTNIAEITDAEDINGIHGDGADSTLANAEISDIENYKDDEAIKSSKDSYIAGQEDDDDFEKLMVKEFDLALRKFITTVSNANGENTKKYNREPVVDASKLETKVNEKLVTTAIYKHSKEPVIVETGDIVTYTIRVYNEGTLNGYVNEITDNIPEGLEFLPNSSINVSYKWKMLDANGEETTDLSKASIIVTNYLSKETSSENELKAVSKNEDGLKTLDYKDVQVQFKVIAKAEKLKENIIKNEAQISEDSDRDIDSTPRRDEKYNYDNANNEDDIDYEPVKLQYFDLALRKFITKVNDTEYNNRYPEVVFGDNLSVTYKQTKDPALVETSDTVIYTIRVYNEGEKPGTATEIKDNIPEGLEFLPDNEVNKEYKWKMLDSEGKETTDIEKAKYIVTDALSAETIDGIVVNGEERILSYKDVKVAFKVTAKSDTDKIIINTAEISKDSDDDIDSTPDNNVENEDDLDKEYIKVQYFDLALKKWVTETRVTFNGKTTSTKTGFNEDSKEIAKVDLVAKNMKKTTVKFVYSIKVINEGKIPGYAYEIKDYIPSGLEFKQEDNKDWKELKDGQVVTDKLKDTLLNPGESATVEIVFTWKNSTTNIGLKTNYAEISKDSGDDIDSVPDNFNKEEDDIDDAQVILSIKTAGSKTYIWLTFISVAILAAGVWSIKKYIIE